jgi:hypothetical protein
MLAPELSLPQGGQFSIDFTRPGTIAETISKNSKAYTITAGLKPGSQEPPSSQSKSKRTR